MLRPERMSKVSVTGSKRVIDDVIEATYEHHSLHVTDYDERYEGFSPGESLDGAERQRAARHRALAGASSMSKTTRPTRAARSTTELEAELADVRDRVNDLNDRRDDFKAEIRDREEEIDRMEPFADLGIELDLLGGYDSLEVVVGEAKPDAVEATLADADGIDAFEVFAGSDIVAIFARPADGADEGVLQDSLVGVDIALLEVPDADASPSEYVAELEREREDSGTTSTRLSPNSRR